MPSGRVITLDGTGSSDPDSEMLFNTWDVTNEAVVLDDENAAIAASEFPIGVIMEALAIPRTAAGTIICSVY